MNETYNVEKGSNATINCKINFTYPTWRGPPEKSSGALSIYNIEGVSNFFASLINITRLSWGSNQKDLVLKDVVVEDDGKYQCSAGGAGKWEVLLHVRGVVFFYRETNMD